MTSTHHNGLLTLHKSLIAGIFSLIEPIKNTSLLRHWPSISYFGLLSSLVYLSGCAAFLTQEQTSTLAQLQDKVTHTRIRVDEKLKGNPESLLRESLTVLDSILEYTEAVKTDPERFSPKDIQAYQLKISIINENIERFSDLKLQADVSFPLGRYTLADLTEYGRQESDLLVDKLNTALQDLARKYPGHTIRLIVKSVGYTDQTSIVPGSQLEQALLPEVTSSASEPEQRRAQLNQVLSRYRADSLHTYVLQSLRQHLPENFKDLEVVSQIVGLGEELPRGTPPEPGYQRKDDRRRVCIVSPFIEVVP